MVNIFDIASNGVIITPKIILEKYQAQTEDCSIFLGISSNEINIILSKIVRITFKTMSELPKREQ